MVDAHFKWVEIFHTNGPSATETIKSLRHCFCRLGIPVTIVSDNGTCFTSQEFQEFLKQNGIRHVTSAVYKSATNGLAERMVQTFKPALAQFKESYTTLLDKFLFKYRLTPHTTTGVSPAELLFKRKLRCRLDLLHPNEMIGSRVNRSQEFQKKHYTGSPRHVDLEPQTPVLVRNCARGPKWSPAVVQKKHGPLSYRCQLEDGRLVERHQDQVIIGTQNHAINLTLHKWCNFLMKLLIRQYISENITDEPPTVVSTHAGDVIPTSVADAQPTSSAIQLRKSVGKVNSPVTPLRRSVRQSRPPDRLNL